jgi:hypothetical protein
LVRNYCCFLFLRKKTMAASFVPFLIGAGKQFATFFFYSRSMC